MLSNAVKLQPVIVHKPWGREIWHSAIEARGESKVLAEQGATPLSRHLKALGIEGPITLLKVLDPAPTPVMGDLYFEVHGHKREVYVVTAINADAWPEGRGCIRFGMHQGQRGQHQNDAAFRAAYLEAVQCYEVVRRAIDRGETGLEDEERRRRSAMEAFTALAPLAIGDVVVVPPRMPHALQHGVRVVEFQTPTYERYIISFAQKVRTQEHWDSKAAIAMLDLEPPPRPTFKPVADGVDLIASFEDFGVWRANLGPRRSACLPLDVPYALCIATRGNVAVGRLRLAPEEACLVPAAGLARHPLQARAPAQCLISAPGL